MLLALSGCALAPEEAAMGGFLGGIDAVFAAIVSALEKVIFFSICGMPLVVLWLIIGAIFFTLRMKLINIRAFRHATKVVRGRYDNPNETGEVYAPPAHCEDASVQIEAIWV